MEEHVWQPFFFFCRNDANYMSNVNHWQFELINFTPSIAFFGISSLLRYPYSNISNTCAQYYFILYGREISKNFKQENRRFEHSQIFVVVHITKCHTVKINNTWKCLFILDHTKLVHQSSKKHSKYEQVVITYCRYININITKAIANTDWT